MPRLPRLAAKAFALTLTLSPFAVSAPSLSAQAKPAVSVQCPDATTSVKSSASPLYALPPTGCGGGNPPTGNGGGGSGSTGTNYNLTWNELLDQNQITLGGVPGRQGPAATVFNGQVYLAYTSTNPDGDGQNDDYVYVGTSGVFNPINVTNGVGASSANPALASVPSTFTGTPSPAMVLAINSEQGLGGQPGGQIGLAYSNPDGTWTYFANTHPNGYPNATYSPSLFFDSNTGILYLAYANANDYTVVLCKTTSISAPFTCNTFPGTTPMNFNPGIAVFNNTLYIAFEARANSHTLSLFTSTDQGQTIAVNNALGSAQNQDQTSVAPYLATFRGALYVGFRTNDSDQHFINRYTTDGVTFSSDENIPNPWGMESTPILIDGNKLNPAEDYLLNYFGSNDGSYSLVSYYGK